MQSYSGYANVHIKFDPIVPMIKLYNMIQINLPYKPRHELIITKGPNPFAFFICLKIFKYGPLFPLGIIYS